MLLLIASLLAVASCSLLPRQQSEDVPLPSRAASPQQVVRVYLKALAAHDCATARALWEVGAKQRADTWCDDLASLKDVTVQQALKDSTDIETDVPVSFEVKWRLFHNDGSMKERPVGWIYQLTRNGPGSPWRIFGQGEG